MQHDKREFGYGKAAEKSYVLGEVRRSGESQKFVATVERCGGEQLRFTRVSPRYTGRPPS